jgi:hypothetical protein
MGCESRVDRVQTIHSIFYKYCLHHNTGDMKAWWQRNKHRFESFFAFAILVLCVIAVGKCSAQSKRDCVVQTFVAQLGVREATGHNDGVDVEKYLASCRLQKGNPWCAAFVNWTLEQCNAPHRESGWAPAWFTDKTTIALRTSGSAGYAPHPGDVFGIFFPEKKRIAHVGFILQWNGDKVTTIEGNTNMAGSREGDGVYKKVRLTKQIYAVANWIDL